MSYTSINHCKNANFQIDHYGIEHDAIASFEKWAVLQEAIWAHLFEEKTGRQVATFNNVQGLSTLR